MSAWRFGDPPTEVDALVVGAGPAGVAAALRLAAQPHLRVWLVDSGRHFTKRSCPVERQRSCRGCGGICNVISGFGGSIHFGDGAKLSQFPSGRRLYERLGPQQAGQLTLQALALLLGDQQVTFRGITGTTGPFTLKNYPVASLTSQEVRRIVTGLYRKVTQAPQLRLDLGVEARELAATGGGFRIGLGPTRRSDVTVVVRARRVVVAVGRRGQRWWRRQVRALGLAFTSPIPSVGLRFECPAPLLAPGAAVHPDFKTTVVDTGVKVKTFCFCAGAGGGRIKFTDYGEYTLLDGHVVAEPGGRQAANFALLAQLRDGAGHPRTQEWIEANLLAPYRALRPDRPGKPVLQWYPDFRRRRVTCQTLEEFQQRAGFTPSLRDYRLANLAGLFAPDLHEAFCNVFEQLMRFFLPAGRFDPLGEGGTQVGVIGLELESLWDELEVTPWMETSVPGLYACGDCAGLAQGILQAAVSGLAAGEHAAAALAADGRRPSTRRRA